mgnify:FL=1
MSNNNYDAVYRNTGTTPRKMHRVEDHYAIHSFRTDLDEAKDFFVEMVIGAVMVGLPMLIIYSLMVWLGLFK